MTRIKLLLVGLVLAGLFCTYLPSAALAIPLTQIEEGEKCQRLNEIIEEGLWSYKCKKIRKKKLWKFNGLSSTTTTTTTIPPTTTMPSAPAAPTGLTLTIKSPFDGTGTISWTDNSSNEDNFYVSFKDPAKLVGLPLSDIWGNYSFNKTSGSFSGAVSGSNYCVWVMASNSVGNSAWTGPACTLAGTATTTTTVYVPPTTVYVPPTTAYTPSYGGGGGSSSANWLGCYFKGKKMWGKVYVTPYSFEADVKVYQTPYSFDADLKVYNARFSFDATSCGKWYVTPYSFDADFKVYFSPYSFSADFKMYVTPYSFEAGR